jgi:hypothetical protein
MHFASSCYRFPVLITVGNTKWTIPSYLMKIFLSAFKQRRVSVDVARDRDTKQRAYHNSGSGHHRRSRTKRVSRLNIVMILLTAAYPLFFVTTVSTRLTLQASAAARPGQLAESTSNASVDLGFYRSLEELQGRSNRFPSVDERLKVYLSIWYVPPCANNTQGFVKYRYHNGSSVILQEAGENPHILHVSSTIERSRQIFLMNRELIGVCKDKFCLDVKKYFFPVLDHQQDDTTPVLLQFGDAEEFKAFVPEMNNYQNYPLVPVIKKFRYSMEKKDVQRITSQNCYEGSSLELAGTVRDPRPRGQGIISIVSNYDRHFSPLTSVPERDIPWEEKKDAAIWRGALTGKNRVRGNPNKYSEEELCRQIPRCNLVLKHGRSALVDAQLVHVRKDQKQPVPPSINETAMFGDSLTMEELLKYKVIIMLEGNDVSSGLKWALFSESVVMMPQPTCTSWALEELLEPWVHYVPLTDDLSDVEEKMQWVIDNDAKAREIARRGQLWMTDLIFHRDAAKDNERVIYETFRRYRLHFAHSPTL